MSTRLQYEEWERGVVLASLRALEQGERGLLERLSRKFASWQDRTWMGGDMVKSQVNDELLQVAAGHMGAYVAAKQQIEVLEVDLIAAREKLIGILFPDGAVPGQRFEFDGLGTVTGMAGRVSEKMERAVLAAAGVDPALLDKATTRKESAPMVRIDVNAPARPQGEE